MNEELKKRLIETYLPIRGEGETLATQAVTAVVKLEYKWFNDGDVFDNTGNLSGWVNDLSSYANWLAKHITGAKIILEQVYEADEKGYEQLLEQLCELVLNDEKLAEWSKKPAIGTIYKCEGQFKFEECLDEED